VATDWFEAETPLHRELYQELDRLRRRAQPRWWLVVLVGLVLTGLLVRKIALKPQLHRARVILAVSEGEENLGWNPQPLAELRQYITQVLLTSERLLGLLEDKHLYQARIAKFGEEYVLDELRDMFEIVVWRNYFQYGYASDERRTARVAVAFTSDDPTFSYDMARALAALIQEAEAERRSIAAFELAGQAADIERAARERLEEVGRSQRALQAAIADADARGDSEARSLLQIRAGSVAVEWQDANQAFESIQSLVSKESLEAAITQAGLALDIQVVDERRPPPIEVGRTPILIAVAIIGFGLFFPLAGVLIGAYDIRVHDVDDVTRLGLPMLGHVPSFPGDDVGALRDRGVLTGPGASLRRWQRSRQRRAKSSIRSSSSRTGPVDTGGSPSG